MEQSTPQKDPSTSTQQNTMESPTTESSILSSPVSSVQDSNASFETYSSVSAIESVPYNDSCTAMVIPAHHAYGSSSQCGYPASVVNYGSTGCATNSSQYDNGMIKENMESAMARFKHIADSEATYPTVNNINDPMYNHPLSCQTQNGHQGVPFYWNPNNPMDFRNIYKSPSQQKPKKPRAKPKCPIKRQNQRSAANVRERTRMKTINEAFQDLKERIPLACKDRKVSKVDTLRLAIRYIHHLHDTVADIDHVMMGTSYQHTSGYQQQQHPVYSQGHQYRNATPYIEGLNNDATGISFW